LLPTTIDLARHCEAIGLRHYWLAEHHNAGGTQAGSCV
jgi:alkanesulfonate monooxygenase SsuD/methylene tetrahydromethanopterin reductase-like flavin-dependent oxidoreductase (luciferase family)